MADVAKYRDLASQHIISAAHAIRCKQTSQALCKSALPAGFRAADMTDLVDLARNVLAHAILGLRQSDERVREEMRLEGKKIRRATPKQLVLLRIAAKEIGLVEAAYPSILHDFGRAESSAELDQLGFEWMLQLFTELGFEPKRQGKVRIESAGDKFGKRVNMASPAQVELIRKLWTEWQGTVDVDNESDINA